MSFWTELKSIMDEYENKHPNKKFSLEEEMDIYRDHLIEHNQYSKVINFILDQYSSRNCVEYMTPLVEQLTKENKVKLYKRIWKPVIKHNGEKFFGKVSILKVNSPNVSWTELESTHTSHIKPYGHQTDDKKENTAFWGKYYLNALQQYKKGLDAMNDEEEAQYIEQEIQYVYNLDKPKLKKKKQSVTDQRKIDEIVFWELIDDSRKNTETKDDFIEVLRERLSGFKSTELKKFQKLLLTYQNQLNHWDIWALAYIVRRGCSDDCFDYFRLWVISRGKETFDSVKNSDIVKFNEIFTNEDPTFEEFEYLAEEVYEEITDKEMKQPSVRATKIKGRQWDEDKICNVYPELCKTFNYNTPKC